MARRIKATEKRLRHNCPTYQSTYTLLETHLTRKDNNSCSANCKEVWEKIMAKYCQEKVLGQQLQEEQLPENDHGSN